MRGRTRARGEEDRGCEVGVRRGGRGARGPRAGTERRPAGWVGRRRYPEPSGAQGLGRDALAAPQRRVQPRKPRGRPGGGRRARARGPRGHGGRAGAGGGVSGTGVPRSVWCSAALCAPRQSRDFPAWARRGEPGEGRGSGTPPGLLLPTGGRPAGCFASWRWEQTGCGRAQGQAREEGTSWPVQVGMERSQRAWGCGEGGHMTPRYWWRSRPSAVFLFPRNTSSSEKQGVGFHSGAKLENAARVRGEGR